MRAALRTDYPESGNSLPRSSSLGYRLTGALTVKPWELRLPSPDGLRPSGSSVRALQVRLNRGSTSCTACRGAAATWARHAIGLANSSRGDQLSTWRAIIGIIARARKTRISFPHACTLITYPQPRTMAASRPSSAWPQDPLRKIFSTWSSTPPSPDAGCGACPCGAGCGAAPVAAEGTAPSCRFRASCAMTMGARKSSAFSA